MFLTSKFSNTRSCNSVQQPHASLARTHWKQGSLCSFSLTMNRRITTLVYNNFQVESHHVTDRNWQLEFLSRYTRPLAVLSPPISFVAIIESSLSFPDGFLWCFILSVGLYWCSVAAGMSGPGSDSLSLLLSHVITLFQMFPTMFKPTETHKCINANGAFHLVACRYNFRERFRVRMEVSKRD